MRERSKFFVISRVKYFYTGKETLNNKRAGDGLENFVSAVELKVLLLTRQMETKLRSSPTGDFICIF